MLATTYFLRPNGSFQTKKLYFFTQSVQVMKDWSDLEEKYQDMREKDPSSAEDFKKKMTERFQKTVQALEEESQAEKRQLQAMHQQRVISMINQKKKMSMTCYTKALNENTPNTHRVQKCLQKLLRALHKDRHHTIQHFRHLPETSLDQVKSQVGKCSAAAVLSHQ